MNAIRNMQRPLAKPVRNLVTAGMVTAIIASSFATSGCGGVSREQVGTISGSVIGGVVGREFGKGRGRDVMTVVGAVVGGMIGGSIARDMDRRDRERVNHSLETAPNYQKVSWDNEETNRHYTFTPVNQYDGRVNGYQTTCRDYIMDAYIDGRMQQVKGRACKNERGEWVNAS